MNQELWEKLARLQWLMRKRHFHHHAGGAIADTTRGQGRILAVLKLHDGISTRDLSYLLGIQISSLNELLAKLEKAGYVTREPYEQDKRVMLCKLTDKGRSEEQADAPNPEDILSGLTEDEQKTLSDLLDKVIQSLGADMDEDDEEWFQRMAAMRERYHDFPNAPFGGRPPYGRGRFGFEHCGRGRF